MAHFAFVNADKKVVAVITVVSNEDDQVPEGFRTWEEIIGQQRPNCTVVRSYLYSTLEGQI